MPQEWEGATVPVPDGVHPLFITGSSQEGFGLQNTTVEDPYMWITRESLLAEIQFKGAISDFFVVKKFIEKYKGGESMLVVLDDDEIYGQNFFMCITPDEADRVIAEEEAKAASRPKKKKEEGEGGDAGGDDEEEDEYVEEPYVPPVSKPWESLGSEAEIAEESVRLTRERFVIAVQRRRREFGATYKFSDRDAQEDPNIQQNDCRPYKDPNFELKRKAVDTGVQAVPTMCASKTQTTWFRPVNKALQHEFIGMGAREIMDALDSAQMTAFLKSIRPVLDEALQQNEVVDIYGDDFADLAEEEATLGNRADSELKELQSYYHLTYCAGRLLTFIQWQPAAKGVVAVAGARSLEFDQRVAVSGKVHTGYILLWNSSDPIHPQYVLEAPGDIYCFRFCPTNVDKVIGGLEGGQVAVWDLAVGRKVAAEARQLNDDADNGEGGSSTITCKATVLSAVDQSHRRAITDLVWLPASLEVSEKGKFSRIEPAPGAEVVQFASVGGDGVLLFWDLRKSVEVPEEKKEEAGGKNKKEGWGPTAKMPLHNTDGGAELTPTLAMLDVPDDPNGACRLYTASEDGEFITVELLNPEVENSVKGVKAVVAAHTGPCVTLQRSPLMPELVLSVGDWSFNVWKKGVASPLFVSPFCSCLHTCGVWSPTRAAVLFLGRTDGNIDIWDFNDRSHEPSMTISATAASVTSMEFHHASANRQLLAVGDDQGTVHVMEVPRNLRRAAANEKAFAHSFFVREERRVEWVEQRMEAVKADKEAARDAKADAPPVATGGDEAKEGEEPEETALEKEFRAMEETFLAEMGFGDAAAPAD